jgi:cytochrome oxidase assembly protein ShyY1
MTRRPPIVATIVVLLAVGVMIALGVWQLDRLRQKEAALIQYRANLGRPSTAYPARDLTDGRYLFRTVSATCLRVTGWRTLGGRAADGRSGWRHIAECATGAEGPGLIADMGIGADPNATPRWRGGPVRGIATWEPDAHSLFARMIGRAPPPRLMIVAAEPAPGLRPSARPDPAQVPNNHLAYAVQWFLFAAVALVIYVLALRRRTEG